LETKEYQHIPINEQVEVMSLAGNIALYNGEPKIHAHIVIGKRDGTAHGGHIIEAAVRPTLEMFLTESPQTITRILDKATNLPLLNLEK
jgi:predicted DNA-binding protein with PD1-like motif